MTEILRVHVVVSLQAMDLIGPWATGDAISEGPSFTLSCSSQIQVDAGETSFSPRTMSQLSDLDKPPEATNVVKTHVYLPPRIHEEKYQAHVPVFDENLKGKNDE